MWQKFSQVGLLPVKATNKVAVAALIMLLFMPQVLCRMGQLASDAAIHVIANGRQLCFVFRKFCIITGLWCHLEPYFKLPEQVLWLRIKSCKRLQKCGWNRHRA